MNNREFINTEAIDSISIDANEPIHNYVYVYNYNNDISTVCIIISKYKDYYNLIENSESDSYKNVKKILWKAGPLRKDVLEKFPNIEVFECKDNKLTTMNGIPFWPHLKNINCFRNNLKNLDGMQDLVNLEIINISENEFSIIHYQCNNMYQYL